MKVISVNIGKKRKVQWKNKTFETGMYKYPVEGSIFLGTEDVVNDDVVDRRYHGGIEKAVYAYGENHYEFWKMKYPELDFNFGMFGENLTVSILNEEDIKVGSVYQLGEAKIEVTKPREPCVKLGIRFNDASVVRQFWNTTKSGVYFKVLKPGKVTKNDVFTLLEKDINALSIADVYLKKKQT